MIRGSISSTERWRRRVARTLSRAVPKLARAMLRLRSRALTRLAVQADVIREQAEALAHYKKIIERSSAQAKIGVWECTLPEETLSWTDGTYDLFDLPQGSPITRTQILHCYEPESLRQLEHLRTKAIEERNGFNFEARIRTAKGNERWIRVTANVECEKGVPVRIFGMKQDITEEKVLLDRLRVLAECDLLTGLANRSVLQARLLEGPKRAGALLLIDLDGFKQINDTFGHSAGDECLKQMAARLRQVCGANELVARMGGDEFAIVVGAPILQESIMARADLILAQLRAPIAWNEHSFQLGGSIGIAIVGVSTRYDASQLFIEADLALYAAKAGGKNTSRIFTADLRTEADARFRTIRTIAAALADDQLELFYQPKIRLADAQPSGFEALLRWRQSDDTIVSAAAFEAAFEDPQLSNRIGEWVVERALCQARDWDRDGLDFGHIAINLSAPQFRDARFADRLIARIASHGLRPQMIQVEVTEGVFLNQEAGLVLAILKRLRAVGIRIALDDFGTGYASLVHLRTYPIDIIKVDKSFVQHFLTSRQDRAILEATLALGSMLDIDIVAEGIEKKEHFEFLKLLGCRYGQGYYFSEAVPAAATMPWQRPAPRRAAAVCDQAV